MNRMTCLNNLMSHVWFYELSHNGLEQNFVPLELYMETSLFLLEL
jgi:hypothetical protein